MNESPAVVKALDGDFAVVEIAAPSSACGRCEGRDGCGKSVLDFAAPPRRYSVRNTAGARAGDEVLVAVPDGAVLKAALLTYLVPVAAAIGGGAIGSAVWGGDAASVMGVGAGLVAGFGFLRVWNRRMVTIGEPLLTMRLKRQAISFGKEDKE